MSRTDMRIVLSVPWESGWLDPATTAEHPQVRVLARPTDWQLSRGRRVAHTLRNARRVLRASATADAVVVCTTATDAIAAALVLRGRPRVVLAVWDLLLPRSPLVRRIARVALRRVDRWLVIRRSDSDVFTRKLGATAAQFVPYPAFAAVTGRPGTATGAPEEDYIYAAGTAHRDWPTLLAAAAQLDTRLVISTHEELSMPSGLHGRVELIGLRSPADGRTRIANAAVVCVPFVATDLPAGPAVIVDAMALGTPVVATDVGGSRDYVEDGVTGRLVPPGDPAALAAAVRELMASPELRARLGAEAARRATTDLAACTVLAAMIESLPPAR